METLTEDFEAPENSPVQRSQNLSLNSAVKAKKDEFYTTYEDIEKELACYPDTFIGKTVIANCDNPFISQFFAYFVQNFNTLGLRKLITSHHVNNISTDNSASAHSAIITEVPPEYSLATDTDFAKLFAMAGNSLNQLTENGDFRSDEVIALTTEADIVVTNPPFSLFRDYMRQLQELGKDFIILGNMNAVTYKEVFPLFAQKKLWYGVTIRSGDRKFFIPEDYPLGASTCGTDENGKLFIKVKGVRWFTNLTPTVGFTSPLNLTEDYTPERYPKYENYDIINVNKTSDIPCDYDGIMGVPITFLDKYDPKQFEIIMLANGNTRTSTDIEILKAVGYTKDPRDKGGAGIINGKNMYARIFIRKISSQTKESHND